MARFIAAFILFFGLPVYAEMVIKLENGKTFVVPVDAKEISSINFREGKTQKPTDNPSGPLPETPGNSFRVGPSGPYQKPSEVANRAANGDTVDIEAGEYPGDVAVWRQNNLILRGVGGRAHLNSKGNAADGKAIWVIKGNNVVIENIEFSGARVEDKNGAGIRFEGTNLTIRNCHFHDNEMGILTGKNPKSEITIENSEFGTNTVDYKRYKRLGHNIYIGGIRRFTLKGSYIHDAYIGHNVKSRARANYILYNRIMDQEKGSSYLIDLADGGDAYIVGNLFHQSPANDNPTLISFASERNRDVADQNLHVVNNTFVNDGRTGVFVWNRSIGSAYIINNLFVGKGEPLTGKGDLKNNIQVRAAKLRNPGAYDYRLTAGSKAIEQGVDPGIAGNGFNLLPRYQYVHPTATEERSVSGKIDIGAYEYSK